MKNNNIVKNFIYQSGYQLLISILPFITSPYIARVLGAEKIGIFSYSYSVIKYFILIANLGISSYGNRTIARVRESEEELNKTFSSLLILHSALSIISLLAYGIYIYLFVEEYRLICLIQAFYLVGTLLNISWFYFGLEKFKLTVTRDSVIKIITVVAIFIFVKSEGDLWKYTLIMALGTCISQSIMWVFLKKYVSIVLVSLKDILAHIRPLLILFGATLALTVLNYTDQIMLGKMSSMNDLGFYSNAYKMIEFPVGFITALGTVMLPKISSLIGKNNSNLVKMYIQNSMRFSLLMSSALVFGVAGISKEFSVIFWGNEFEICGLLMQVLSISIIFISWNNIIRTQYLIPNEMDKIYLRAVGMGAISNVIVNFICIPKLGAIGACIGTIIGYIVICFCQTFPVRQKLPIYKYVRESSVYYLAGFIMYIVIRLIGNYLGISAFTIVCQVGVGIIIFVSITLIIAKITDDKFIMDIVTKTYQGILNSKLKEKRING